MHHAVKVSNNGLGVTAWVQMGRSIGTFTQGHPLSSTLGLFEPSLSLIKEGLAHRAI